MRTPILVVVEENGNLAEQIFRLIEAQGLLTRLTIKLREACDLLSQSLDIVLLAAPFALAAVRTASFVRKLENQRILVVASARDSKESMIEIMEAGAFSFMRSPAPPKAIVKEVHRIRRLVRAA